MRPLALLTALLLPAPALAGDGDVGVDVDLAAASGDGVSGLGGGVGLHLGYGPNPLKLGPSALSILAEVAGTWYRFPDVEEGDTDMIRAVGGARGILTLLWLRAPAEEGGRGRGIRLDVPIALHVGAGTVDLGTTWTPTADASLGVALGLLPVELGIHVGVGGLAASPDVQSMRGSAWVNAGVDVGIVF